MIDRIHSNPQFPDSVILNLFQDPSGGKHRSPRLARYAAPPGGERADLRFGRAEKWTLKQVQGDEGIKNQSTIQLLHNACRHGATGVCESRLKMETAQ